MGYKKLNLEIKKYLQANNLPCGDWIGNDDFFFHPQIHTRGKTDFLPLEHYITKEKLEAYYQAKDVVFDKWLKKRKYKELILCTFSLLHSFRPEEFRIPLTEYFVATKNLNCMNLKMEIRNSKRMQTVS